VGGDGRALTWLRSSSGHECHSGTERELLIS
jgi:hypothetical protein